MMNKYDYMEALKQDIREWLQDNRLVYSEDLPAHPDDMSRGDYEAWLYDQLFTEDSVTGNASGSYTFSTARAAENIMHNVDLLEAAAEAFGISPEIHTGYQQGPEYWDVTIRCYLLPDAISAALDEMEMSE